MLTTKSRRSRPVAAGAVFSRTGLAWAGLTCAALLVTACSSVAGSVTASAASTPAGSATPAGSPTAPASPAAPSVTPSVTASPSGTSVFLAPSQDTSLTPLYEPACTANFGCPLSGDSTAFLAKMKWSSWSAAQAVGTGTYKLNDCNPNCAGGEVFDVATVVTFSQPVKVCSASGTRWFWSRASFRFPNGLPSPLQGDGGPQNPWTFTDVVTAAQQSCHS